jgi:hypothetical protein
MLVAVSRPRLPRLQKATALAVDECADGRDVVLHRNEFCVVAGSLSDHIQPLFPWDGLTIFEPQSFGYVSHNNPF